MFDIILCFLIIFIITWLFRKKRKQPPGPRGLPLLGYYPFVGDNCYETFDRLSKKYGEIVSINILGENYWILNSFEAIEEALVSKGEYFTGRSRDEYDLNSMFAKNSFVASEGEKWKTQLKFILAHLSQLGMGKSHFEATIHALLDNVEQMIEEKNGEPHDYQPVIANYVLNVGATLIYSKQHDLNDPDGIRLIEHADKRLSSFNYLTLLLTGDIFKYWLKFTSSVEQIMIETDQVYADYSKKLVDERMATFDASNCGDLLDYWIKESVSSKREYFKYEYVAENLSAMLLASLTPATLILSLLYHMASNPKIQRKVYQEICDIVGVDGDFCLFDKDRMHITRAVIAEVLRFEAYASLVHWNIGTTKLRGYDVPRRQKVVANVYTLSRDSKHFANPNEFDPNNFLDENGCFKSSKYALPFGIGVRKCPGQKLADVEVFVAFVRLIRKFEWLKCDPKLMDSSSIAHIAPYRMCAIRRK